LPIVGRFQTKRRRGDSGGDYREPPDFTIMWGEPIGDDEYRVRERLTSPLIIKALPLADGHCAAIALWLHRDWPAGKIVLEIRSKVVPGSATSFDALVAPGDTPLFTALAGKPTLRAAFLDWLALRSDVVTVFPHRDVAGGAP
jgi:CRISPR-associated protein Cmr1